MKNRIACLVAASVAPLFLAANLVAQQPQQSPPERPGAVSSASEPIFRTGGRIHIAEGDRVEDVVSALGELIVDGEVDGDMVAMLSTARLSSTAVVDGDLVVVGGSLTVEPGAVVSGDMVVVGGSFDGPSGFSAGGEQVIVGAVPSMGGDFSSVIRWITEGLLWGRLIVPSIAWVWLFVLVQLLLFLVVNLVFERPVRTSVDVLVNTPLTAVLAGVLVVLLSGPVTLVLAVSVVGLPVIPMLWFALFLAAIYGHVAVSRWIGDRIVAEPSPAQRLDASRSVAIGFGALCVAYMVPVLGITVWLMVGVIGLGAAAATFYRSLRGEHGRPVAPPALPGPLPADGPAPESESVEIDPVQRDEPDELELARFSSRLGSLALDGILLAIVCALADLDVHWAFFAVLAYHVALWSWISTTVGGIICRVRLVRTDRTPLQFSDALVRGLAGIFSLAVAGLGWLWILWDERRQSWHDRVAGTFAVAVPPGSEGVPGFRR